MNIREWGASLNWECFRRCRLQDLPTHVAPPAFPSQLDEDWISLDQVSLLLARSLLVTKWNWDRCFHGTTWYVLRMSNAKVL